MGGSGWVSIAPSPGGCNQVLGQAGEKAFPSTADLGLEGLQTEPRASPHILAKVDSGKEWAGPPGCYQKLPPQLPSAPFCLLKVLKQHFPPSSTLAGQSKAVLVSC